MDFGGFEPTLGPDDEPHFVRTIEDLDRTGRRLMERDPGSAGRSRSHVIEERGGPSHARNRGPARLARRFLGDPPEADQPCPSSILGRTHDGPDGRRQADLRDAKLGRDVATLEGQLAEMEDWAKVAEMADSQREWLRQFNQLWPRLLRPSPEARREVFALLDVQVTVLGTERQPKLHIDGAIPPDSVTLDAVSRAIVGNPVSEPRR